MNLWQPGVPLATSLDTRVEKAFGNLPGKIIGVGLKWQFVVMTRLGRAHVARKQCLLSKSVYQSSYKDNPGMNQRLAIQRAVNASVYETMAPAGDIDNGLVHDLFGPLLGSTYVSEAATSALGYALSLELDSALGSTLASVSINPQVRGRWGECWASCFFICYAMHCAYVMNVLYVVFDDCI